MTPIQCKMARAALGCSAGELAQLAGVGINTVTRFERGTDSRSSTVRNLQSTLEAQGIIFIDADDSAGPGVRVSKRELEEVSVQHIGDLNEIPPGTKYVLVMYGDRNQDSRHSRGLTITVDKSQPNDQREASFSMAVESAKQVASDEGIRTVFVRDRGVRVSHGRS